MRLRLLATALTLSSAGLPAAHAQDAAAGFDAAAAIEDFLTDAALLGAETATVGEVSANGDTVTASDVTLRWTATIEAVDETATITAEATAPSLEITGLSRTDAGYEVAGFAAPTLRLAFTVVEDGETDTLSVTFTDYTLEGASWAPFPVIAANAAAPVSRFAPLVDWAVRQSYRSNSVGRIEGFSDVDGVRQEFGYGPVTFGPIKDGQVDELNYGELTVVQDGEFPAESGELKPGKMTITYGPIAARKIDIRPMAALLTGTDAADGPQPVIDSMVVDKVTVTAGDAINVSLGPIALDGFTLDPSRGPLMTEIDDLVVAGLSGEEPEPQNIIGLMLDIYGAYGIKNYSLKDVKVDAPDVNASLGEVSIAGLSSAGLDDMSVRDMKMNSLDTSLSLGAFEMGGFVFPERDDFMAAITANMTGVQPDPQLIMQAIPTFARLAVRDLRSEMALSGSLSLKNFALDLGGYVNAIPTTIAIALEGLEMPASMLPNQGASMMAQMIGADPVTADGTLKLRWDDDTKRVELSEDFTVGNVGALTTEATLSGIPRVIFEDPSRVQEALATAAINGLSLDFTDGGVTPFVLGMVSQQSGVDTEDFIEGIASQTEMQVATMTGDDAFAAEVAGAVRAYLSDPQSLSVAASPSAPVSVAQIIGAAMTAPQTLPGLLNLVIQANE